MTPCECPLAGYCNRHRMTKIGALFALCKTDQRYYDRWETTLHERKERPLTIAYNHWAPLHYYAVKHANDWDESAAKKWYRVWKLGLPKTGCGCAASWKKETEELPPKFGSAKEFFEWSWMIHDKVSERLSSEGKPHGRPTLAECYEIWNFHAEK